MIAVVRWFIATLKGQYTARNTSMGSEKKPLNPVLGEVFYGNWPDTTGDGELRLTSEQVSHHPPVTAYFLENEKLGVSVEGHSGQKTSFNGHAISVVQVGHAILRAKRSDGSVETYLITLPTLSIDGLWYGSPYIELTGDSYIHSSTGMLAKIHYSGRGYFSGKAYSFHVSMTKSSAPTQSIFEASGVWAGESTITKSPLHTAGTVFWDADAQPRQEITVKPLEEMGEYESRRLWKTVADGIRSGNYDVASKDKSRIEHEQRALRKQREADGTQHQLKHFELIESDPDYAALSEPCKHQPPTQKGYKFRPTP